MSEPAAILATYSDFKLIKTRGVLQLIFEVDLSKMPDAFKHLGYPTPGTENFVGIAKVNTKNLAGGTASNPGSADGLRLNRPPAKTFDNSARAALLTKDPEFWPFIMQRCGGMVHNEAQADIALKRLCSISSKRELDGPLANKVVVQRFEKLTGDFRAWQQARGHGVIQ